jgi:hypothetical protein
MSQLSRLPTKWVIYSHLYVGYGKANAWAGWR